MNEKPPYDAPPGATGSDADSGAEPEPTAEELARAASLARLVDRISAGEPPPPAMPAEDRLLLDAAAMIHAAHQPRQLPARKVNELVAAALAQPDAEPRRSSRKAGPDKTEPGFVGPVLLAFPGGARREAATATAPGDADADLSAAPERGSASGIDLRPRSTRLRVMVGTVVLAMAAALALWVWSARQNRLGAGRPGGAGLATGSGLGQKLRSRSAGSLLGGPIASAESGNARARMDLVFADRLSGYREVVFRGRARRGVATEVSP
ncbi:MAG: hypothetical protein IT370_18905 [Deltaproteobacteria bacterium]|nr:hypothetical protein [Deltaproteobacteria bacterium]